MDIFERLERDHQEMRRLLASVVETSEDGVQRRSLFAQLRDEVKAHAAAEEEVFYAALLARSNAREQARHSVVEHKQTDDLLEELQQLDPGADGWLEKFGKLKELLEHHADEEEQDVFVTARQTLSDDRTDEMATAFDRRKREEMA